MPAVEVSPEEAMQRLMQAAGPGAGGSGPVREGFWKSGNFSTVGGFCFFRYASWKFKIASVHPPKRVMYTQLPIYKVIYRGYTLPEV